MEHLDKTIGQNMKRIRGQHGLSMDQVAALTGVSKSMIARIESGASTPTVTTLWKICNGLKVSFSTMLDDPTELDVVVNKEALKTPMINDAHDLYAIIPFNVNNKFELYEMIVQPKMSHSTAQHVGVNEEVVFVQEGELVISIGENERRLFEGDVYRFKPDAYHTYTNEGVIAASFIVTLIYS